MKIILKHGPAIRCRDILEGELVYLTDTRQLVTGDGVGGYIVLAHVYETDGQLVMQNPDMSYSTLFIKP